MIKFFVASKIDGLLHCRFMLNDVVYSVTTSEQIIFIKKLKSISLKALCLASIALNLVIPLGE